MATDNQSQTDQAPTEALFKFISSRPQWEQDAVRRLYLLGALTENDYQAIYDLFRSENKLPQRDNIQLQPAVALDGKNLPERSNAQEQLVLKKIHGIQNVARLATGQAIDVGANLTLIYGDNGAGKSGYTRILKKACGARSSAEAILANVKDPEHAKKGPGSIVVDCTKKSQSASNDIPIAWNTGLKGPDTLLKRVQVFDNTVASFMITKDNEVPVVPYNFDLLDKLANDVFADIKQKLKADEDLLISTINTLIESIPEDFGAREAIKAPFTGDRNEMEKRLSGLSDEDSVRFNQLHGLINNRDQQTARLDKEVKNLEKAIAWVQKIYPLLAPTAVDEFKNKISSLLNADAAVTQALPQAFKNIKSLENPPFPGIGGNPWRMLWDAAKEFCVSTAYPQESFPVAVKKDGTDAHCPLCLQELQPEAQERFTEFQKFVETSVVKTRDELKAGIAEIKQKIEMINPSYLNAEIISCFDENKPVQAGMQEFYENLALLKDNALKAINAPAGVQSLEFPAIENSELALQNLKFEKEAQLTEAKSFDQDPDAPKKREDYIRLGRRKALIPHKDAILKIYDERQLLNKYYEASKKLDTGPVTRQKTSLMEKYFNDDFIEAFKNEKTALGIRFPAIVNVRQSAAVSSHKPGLEKYHHKKIDEILSEGEKRALALAAFFTELEVASTNDPVIFDDPVSSLDHMYRENVSERLAKLAMTRQVIVFTHDLVFFTELQAKAKKHSCPVKEFYLKTELDHTGLISNELPWDVQTLKSRIGDFDQKYAEAEKLYNNQDPAYTIKAENLGGYIRKTWERLIEDCLFNGVVKRYRKTIQTQQITEIVITPNMLSEIEKGMTETSNWADHDKAQAFQASPPSLPSIKTEIDRIKDCYKLIMDAQKKKKTEDKQDKAA